MDDPHIHKQRLSVHDILELEKLLLHGQSVEARLSLLDAGQLQASPLLLKEKGELLMREGRLLEAQRMLEMALRGLASAAMEQDMLACIGLLARTCLRTGQRSQAETLLTFLHTELREPSPILNGHPAWALAVGCHLLDAMDLASDCYNRAASHFEEKSDWNRAARVYADKLFRLHGQLSRASWMEDWHRLKHLSGFTPIADPLNQLLLAADLYFSERWEQAAAELNKVKDPLEDWFWRQLGQEMGRQLAILLGHHPDFPPYDQRSDECQDIEIRYWMNVTCLLQQTANPDPVLQSEKESDLSSLIQRGVHPVFQTAAEKAIKRMQQVASSRTPLELWHISWFGGLAFKQGEKMLQELPWKRRKSLELLLLLLTSPRYSVSRDWAMELLFGESDFGHTPNQLYVAVYQLRKVLKEYLGVDQAVQLKDGTIRLLEEWVETLDIEHYTTLIRVGDQLWFSERDTAVELYEQAAEMYNTPLPEIQYIDWLDRYRSRLAEQQSRILQRLGLHCQETGRLEEAAAYAERWIELNPAQEEAYQLLLTVLMRAGRDREAWDWYHRWETFCLVELGAEPHPATKRILAR